MGTSEKKTWVIKVGGAVLDSDGAALALFSTLNEIQKGGELNFVLVHGGGSLVDRWLEDAGFATAKHQGLRISPKEQIPYIVGALSGCANKQLMSQAIISGLSPVGLSLYEAGFIAEQKLKALGQVGTCVPNGESILLSLFALNKLPLISSVGLGEQGELFNVNADEAAASIAKQLDAELIFMTDVEAVLDQNKQPLHQLDEANVMALIKQGVINGGMEVKVKTSLQAAHHLRRGVYISSWKKPNNLVGLIKGQHIGTQITP